MYVLSFLYFKQNIVKYIDINLKKKNIDKGGKKPAANYMWLLFAEICIKGTDEHCAQL